LTPGEALRALNLIESYSDRSAFERAERLKKWLSQPPGRTTESYSLARGTYKENCILSMKVNM